MCSRFSSESMSDDYILDEDSRFIADNKPGGLPSHFVDNERPVGVLEMIRYLYNNPPDTLLLKLAPHLQLEADISGVSIITKMNGVEEGLKEQFRPREQATTEKRYYAV